MYGLNMSRPSLGKNARTETLTARFKAEEVQAIDAARHGLSRSQWVRLAAIEKANMERSASAPRDARPSRPPDPPTGGRHLHRAQTKIDTLYRKGTKVEVWVCECGHRIDR